MYEAQRLQDVPDIALAHSGARTLRVVAQCSDKQVNPLMHKVAKW